MVAGVFDTSCPSPAGTDQQVVGAVFIKRDPRPRLDIWLGGHSGISNDWAGAVVEFLKVEYQGAEVFRYKPHYSSGKATSGASGVWPKQGK